MPSNDRVELVARRSDVLEPLVDDPLEKRDLVARLDHSRSTVDRAVRRLEEAGLVRRGDDGYVATFAGRLALDRYRAYRRESQSVLDAEDVLAPLPIDCDLGVPVVADADVRRSDGPAPYRVLESVHDDVATADRYCAVLPALDDPRHFRHCYEHVVTDGNPAELIVDPTLLDTLRDEFPRRLTAMAEAEHFDLLVADVPRFALVVTEGEETTVSVIIFDDGTVHGTLRNGSDRAVRWARRRIDALRSAGTDATDRVRQPDAVDGGIVTATGGTVQYGLPVALEREGFVRLSRSYFADSEVADPPTAWRSGLDLAEVHTGYPIERTVDAEGETRSLRETVTDRLRSGADCALVGPPGAGKSTTCKAVACEWYRAGDPVFYREGGRGAAFESVEELVAAVRSVDGRPLVVVEDAVRPEAAAVFEAMRDLEDEAAFLLDGRESEWENPRDDAFDADLDGFRNEHVAVVSMPRLDDRESDRLVRHVASTFDVDIPIEEVREAVRTDVTDETRVGEPLLLLHRLSLYATDADSATTLRDDARQVLEELREVGVAPLEAGIVVNVLNAVGAPVTAGQVQAVANEAFQRTLDVLTGRVLFEEADGRYRTVHEWWSIAFLEALSDVTASERFGRGVTRLLALADDEERRRRARERVNGATPVLDRIDAEPNEWADDTVERLFGLGVDRPKFASLFGTSWDTAISLPEACSSTVRDRTRFHRAQMLMQAGDLDAAETEFERLREDTGTDDLRLKALYGLGDVARRRSDFETAQGYAREALEVARSLGADRHEAVCRQHLGVLAEYRGDLETAADHLTEALEMARDAGDLTAEADILDNLGIVYRKRGEFDAAEDAHEQCLDIRERLNDAAGEERVRHNLANLYRKRGDLQAAERQFRQSLEIARDRGTPRSVQQALGALGDVAYRRGDFETARDRHERGVERAEELGNRTAVAEHLADLGRIALASDRLDDAAERADRALSVARDIGDRATEAKVRRLQARIARSRGDIDVAEEHATRSLSLARNVDHAEGIARSHLTLGRIQLDRGTLDDAEDHLRTARERAESANVEPIRADALTALAELARARGDYETAVDRYETAFDAHRDVSELAAALDDLEALVSLQEETGDEDEALGWCEVAVEMANGTEYLDARRFRDRLRE